MSSPQTELTPQLFWETMTGFQRSAILKAAVDLNIFTIIAGGKHTVAEIAAAADASERGVRILCDSLTVIGFLEKSDRHYKATLETSTFLDRNSPAYVADAVNFILSPVQKKGFDQLTESVKNGGAGITGDASLDPESEMWVTFAQAMAPLMFPAAQAAAANIGFDTDRPLKVLDIAAGHGFYGLAVASAYPNAHIYGADWKNVLKAAESNAERFGVSDRYHTIPGNAFESDLGTGYDVILVPNFFHHFDMPTCEGFIRKLGGALAEGGKILTIEFVPNDDRISPVNSAMFSIVMLAATPAGDAYTFAEYQKMFEAAGFADNKLVSLAPLPSDLIISMR